MREEALVKKLVSKTGIQKRTPITLTDAAEKYYDEVVVDMKARSTFEYQLANLLSVGDSAHALLSDIKTADFTAYRAKRRFMSNGRGGKVAGSTINREVELARRMFNWLDDLNYDVPRIKWKLALDRNAEVKRIRELKPDEEVRLFAALGELHPELYLLCEFAMLSGQRLSALIGLTWDRVDFPNREITVFLKTKLKAAKPHVVPMDDRMEEIIRSFPEVEGWANVFTYISRNGGGGRKWEGRRNRAGYQRQVNEQLIRRVGRRYPFSEDGWRTVWKQALEKAGVTNFRFHDLRHTALTRLVRETGNLRIAMELAGHADISTTTRYAHADKSDVRAAMKTVANRRRAIQEERDREAVAAFDNVFPLRVGT